MKKVRACRNSGLKFQKSHKSGEPSGFEPAVALDSLVKIRYIAESYGIEIFRPTFFSAKR